MAGKMRKTDIDTVGLGHVPVASSARERHCAAFTAKLQMEKQRNAHQSPDTSMKHFTPSPAARNAMAEGSKTEGFFLASILLDALETLRARDIDAEAIGQALGLNLHSLLADPNAWLPTQLLETILRKALSLYPDPLMGLHASQSERDSAFGVLGYLGQTCATLQEVFTTKARYERLVSNIGTTTLRQEQASSSAAGAAIPATRCSPGTPPSSCWASGCGISDRSGSRSGTCCYACISAMRLPTTRHSSTNTRPFSAARCCSNSRSRHWWSRLQS